MRELKFRAWYYEHGEKGGMFYDCLPEKQDFTEWLIAFDGVESGYDGAFVLGEHIEVMQYTGLKDKNGKEIYEGDILEINGEYCRKNNLDVYMEEITWEHACFLPRITENEEWEVIGNIYQNKELLK